MRRLFPALVVLLSANPVAAEVWEYGDRECRELWFMRNLIMDRAGYCFGSALGRALFDNRDCSGADIDPGPDQRRQVSKIQALESRIGCRVDTTATELGGVDMQGLRRLRDMPLPDNGGSACVSWRGKTVPLHDGYGPGSRVIGQLRPGDRVDFGFIGEGDWNVISVASGAEDGRLGWLNMSDVDWSASCTDWVG
ncbi:DUF4453 domain-containing protein [Paracoccus salsus]|uniref:DUF4453 domain-containing protein n=1 Tax=Paracoccus salsus TaxID=2911061 RepID=UPI001F161E81|nr:DUF4453 domain-containing protein [Paracoccus salsus]MCF3972282.1 DUF4453 domain-containing protein [Paracoccus salsus]